MPAREEQKSPDFIEYFEKKTEKTIKDYDLVSKKDKVIVACSGGKDSTAVLYLLHKLGYDVEALNINLLIGDWSEENLLNLRSFCKGQKIRLHEVNIRDEMGYSICYIRSAIQSKVWLKNCTICGVIKRWILNRKARELFATKIATGHNLDDEAQTIFMNILKGNPKMSLGLGQKSGVTSDRMFVQRVKPLYFSPIEEIRKYSMAMNFPVLYDPCPCSTEAFRRDIKNELDRLEKEYPTVKYDLVYRYLKMKPMLSTAFENKETFNKLSYCKSCGEPTRNDICKACELLRIIKMKVPP